MRSKPLSGRRERGAVAVMVATSLVVLIGMLALAIDLGQLFIARTKLQTAADACALSAVAQLDGTNRGQDRGRAAGISVSRSNMTTGWQDVVTVAVSFTSAIETFKGSSKNYDLATCSLRHPSLSLVLAPLLNFANSTALQVNATARMQSAATACAIPLAMCRKENCTTRGGTTTCTDDDGTSPLLWGYSAGDWVTAPGTSNGKTGNFNWVDFTKSSATPDVKALLAGPGYCNIDPVNQEFTPIGITGARATMEPAWNTRFGVYDKGGSSNCTNLTEYTDAEPDFSGHHYATRPSGGALNDFLNIKRPANAPYTVTSSSSCNMSATGLRDYGRDRRFVIAPVMRCSEWDSVSNIQNCGKAGKDCSTTPHRKKPVGWACMLMVQTYSDTVAMEIVGTADDPSSPCGQVGQAVSDGVGGRVPVLVQ